MSEHDPLEGLPPDLAALLRDPRIIVPQDAGVFEMIAKWMNAPCDTPSATHPADREPSLDTMRSRIYDPVLYPSLPNQFGDLRSDALRLLDLLDVRERDLAATAALLRKWSAEKLLLKEALLNIVAKARWYAENDERNPHEVDHALCVEVLDLAERALDSGDSNSQEGPSC